MSAIVANDLMLATAAAAVRMYAESHPRPLHVTQTQAAEMLGISRPTVASLVKAGRMKLNEVGLIPIGQVDAVLAARDERRRA